MATKIGIHASIKGNTEANIAVATALDAQVFVWLAGDHQPGDALRWPDAAHIVRLPNPQAEPREAVADYARRVDGLLMAWQAAGLADLWFQMGNEPEIAGYDLAVPWGVEGWKQVAGQYLANLRHNAPTARFLSTPFTVANSGETKAPYTNDFDGVALHHYWAASDGPTPLALAYNKPVYLTEMNSNPTDPHQIAAFVKGSAGVAGVAIFIADAPPDFAHYDLSPLDAGVIRALLAEPPAPPPFQPPPVIGRDAYRFAPLSQVQYDTIISRASMAGRSSPLLTDAAYTALVATCHAADIDPRWFLAIVQSESHFGTDPNAANPPNNPAGIKWVGQAGGFDSGVVYPASEGAGTYAGFPTIDAFWRELVRIMHNSILGPAFDAGDLKAVAERYTGGAWGDVKVDIWQEYRIDYPPQATTTLERLHAIASAFVGATATEEGNAEFGMCEQFVEEVQADAGLPRTRFYSAAIHGDELVADGVLRQGAWPRGAILVWNRSFDPNGHICVGSDYPYVITTYPGAISRLDATAINWYPNAGFLGWYIPAGASEEDDMALPIEGHADDGVYAHGWALAMRQSDGAINRTGIFDRWLALVKAGVPIGLPVCDEYSFPDGRTVQNFSSGAVITAIKDESGAWQTYVN